MVSLPIRYDADSLPEQERILLPLLDAKQYVPPVHLISKSLGWPQSRVRESLRCLADAGFLNVREVPVIIDRPEAIR